jgi:hypothetical protein
MKDGRPFTFAGLRENWKDRQTDKWIRISKIITSEANQCRRPAGIYFFARRDDLEILYLAFPTVPNGSVTTCPSAQSQNQNEDGRQYAPKHHSQSQCHPESRHKGEDERQRTQIQYEEHLSLSICSTIAQKQKHASHRMRHFVSNLRNRKSAVPSLPI